MYGWLNAQAAGDFLAIFLPTLAYFMLVHAYRALLWMAWLLVAVAVAGFVAAYDVAGYPRVLSDLAGNLKHLSVPSTAGFIAAWLLGRPLVGTLRRLRAWRAKREPDSLGHASAAPEKTETAAAASTLAALILVGAFSGFAHPIPAQASTRADLFAPSGQWRPLLYLNQIVLDRELRPICHCSIPVEFADLPRHLRQALVAIEDRRFYIHRGVDPLAMLRAVRAFLLGRGVQGGSTLSQQLAKFTLLTDERTFSRKGQDVIWGLKIDAALSKEEILLLYLNRATFGWSRGRPIVGIEQASRFFFGKRARDLNLYEAAALSGLVNAPLRLNPKRNPKLLAARARLVLEKMREEGYVTRREIAAALKTGILRGGAKPLWIEPRYFAEWAMAELSSIQPAIAPRPGLRLFISLDSLSQLHAELALARALGRLSARRAGQGAMVTLDHDGQVRAMVGGRDFAASQFNRAATARRQPASAFKPFVYLAALESGMRTDTKILDVAPEGGAISGKIEGPFRGLLTLRRALALSANGATIRLSHQVGLGKVVAAAQRVGIASPLRADGSLALGTSEVTLIELTAAFAPFANGGLDAQPHGIVAVADRGSFRYLGDGRRRQRVVRKSVALAMRSMLRAVVTEGTGRPANVSTDAAGKTGTSQDNRDALFIGFAGRTVAGLWLGNDDHSPMQEITGSDAALAWANFMANELAR